MIQLECKSTPEGDEPLVHVVFVHGLDSDPSCWARGGAGPWWKVLKQRWPWAAAWTVDYLTKGSEWQPGPAPPISQIAQHLLLACREKGLVDGPDGPPLVFVTHSMGGLVVKRALRRACDFSQHGWFAATTNGVAFFGTPHAGSDLGAMRAFLARCYRPSRQARDLDAHSEALLELNEWYRENAPGLGITTLVYRENRPSRVGWVVKPGFADPGMTGVEPVSVQGDHSEIINLETGEELHFSGVLRLVRESGSARPSEWDER